MIELSPHVSHPSFDKTGDDIKSQDEIYICREKIKRGSNCSWQEFHPHLWICLTCTFFENSTQEKVKKGTKPLNFSSLNWSSQSFYPHFGICLSCTFFVFGIILHQSSLVKIKSWKTCELDTQFHYTVLSLFHSLYACTQVGDETRITGQTRAPGKGDF
jgi:hypothetical protein